MSVLLIFKEPIPTWRSIMILSYLLLTTSVHLPSHSLFSSSKPIETKNSVFFDRTLSYGRNVILLKTNMRSFA